MGNNRGLLIGFKGGAAKNYIDASKYFKKVEWASFSSAYSSEQYYYIFNLRKITTDMKVIFHYIKLNQTGRIISSSFDDVALDSTHAPCIYFIVGELK